MARAGAPYDYRRRERTARQRRWPLGVLAAHLKSGPLTFQLQANGAGRVAGGIAPQQFLGCVRWRDEGR